MGSPFSAESIQGYLDLCGKSGYFATLQAIESDTDTGLTSDSMDLFLDEIKIEDIFLDETKEDNVDFVEKILHKKIALATLEKKYPGAKESENRNEVHRDMWGPFSPSGCVIEDNTRKQLTEEDKAKRIRLEVEQQKLEGKLRSLEMQESFYLSHFDSWEEDGYSTIKYQLFTIYRSKKEIYADLDLKMMELYQLEH